MPEMSPVGNQIRPPDTLGSLSNMLGIKQQMQSLQTGQAYQQEAQQKAKQATMDTQQQQGVQDFFKDFDPSKSMSPDGTVDLDKELSSDRFKNANGLSKPLIVAKLQEIKSKGLSNKQALANLNGDLVKQFDTRVGALADDKDVIADNANGRAKVQSIFELSSQESPDAARIAGIYGPYISKVPQGKLRDAVRAIQMQAQSASEQIATTTPNPTFVQTRQGMQGVNANPNAAMPVGTPMGAPVENAAPPGYFSGTNQQPMVSGPGGNAPHVLGGGVGNAPAGGSAQASPSNTLRAPNGHAWTGNDGAPGPLAPQQEQEAWGQARILARKAVDDARTADQDYGKNIDILGNIHRLADAGGPWSSKWNETLAGKGLHDITDYKLLGAYLESQANALQNTMGLPNTNAGMAGAQTIAAKTDYTPEAIRQKADYLKSLVEGAHRYTRALDRVEGYTGNPNPRTVQLFKSEWRNNFDPRIIEGEDAFKRSPEQGNAFIKRLTQEMSPQETADFIRKRTNLTQLEQGQLPQ